VDDNTLLNRKEAAKMLYISLPTLHQCQKEGRIPERGLSVFSSSFTQRPGESNPWPIHC